MYPNDTSKLHKTTAIKKNTTGKIFSIRPKSTTTTIKGSQAKHKKQDHKTTRPLQQGFHLLPSFLPLILSHQFLYHIHGKTLSGHEWLNPQLGPDRPKSQAMYDVLSIYQCKGIFYSIIFSAFILHYSLYSVRGQTGEDNF